MRRLRIAFVTDEFVTEWPDAGGLGGYLNRITRALCDLGHEVEVVTRTFGEPRVIDHGGVRVESVRPRDAGRSGLARALARLRRRSALPETGARLRTAASLARAFERRQAAEPFDFVQSTNCGLAGLLIRPRPGLRHVLRLSSVRDLWLRAGERPLRLDDRLVALLERRSMRRANAVYAPSRFLADRLREERGTALAVVRPPAFLECKPAPQPPAPLPERFLLHFGTLMRRKGSELLAEALPLAWDREPELRMVWAGREWPAGNLARYRAHWGARGDQVLYLGSLARSDLYSVLCRASACVLPSLADNLPNTVIESLLLSVPVIGSRGASIDELVEDGASGALVPVGDREALAEAMARAWRGDAPWLGAGFVRPACLERMTAAASAENLIRFALGDDAP